MSCATRIANNFRNSFYGIILGVSKKWVKSWSHAFLINNFKTFSKKLLAVHPEKGTRIKKRKKNLEWQLQTFSFERKRKNYCKQIKGTPHITLAFKPFFLAVICLKINSSFSMRYFWFKLNFCLPLYIFHNTKDLMNRPKH